MVKLLSLQPSKEQVSYCKGLLDGYSVGNRGFFDGDYYQQLSGIIAQKLVTDLLGLPPVARTNGFDGGFDLEINGFKWDVKCVRRHAQPKLSWVCNVPEPQTKYAAEGYIFVSQDISTGDYFLLGWISKEHFLKKATYHAVGSTITRDDGSFLVVAPPALYDISIRKLNRIRTIKDLSWVGM